MANHAICLLTYLADNPMYPQSYRKIAKATGIPYSTIWQLVNWRHEECPYYGSPLFEWADKLNYNVKLLKRDGLIMYVEKRHIY
jgi:hypothetical protein